MGKITLQRLLAVFALTSGATAEAAKDLDTVTLDGATAADGLALGRGLALTLGEMRPLWATHLATTWALSPDPVRRAAVACALEWAFPLVGDAVIIDHLSRDADPQIRAACARAAWIRRTTGGDPGVLARLVDDPDPEVRAVVRRAR
jgi:hypothetical protein